MLKKDLKDKVVLNIFLCLFMIVAATLIVISTTFIFTLAGGIDNTYEKCNTSDGIFLVDKSISDPEGQRQALQNMLDDHPEIGEVYLSERLILGVNRIQIPDVDRTTVRFLSSGTFVLSPVNTTGNIPYDRDNKRFVLESGCIAIPEMMANNAGLREGDVLRVTTDLGNIYEFTISCICKEPSTTYLNKIFFSDEDLEALGRECFSVGDLYEIYLMGHVTGLYDIQTWGVQILDELHALEDEGYISGNILVVTTGKGNTSSDEAMIALIVSIFMGITGVVLILMIFMVISFTLHATIKREEREIGTMKAIGVDSLSYKSLFIVKYIAFAILGGVIGLVAGIPLSEILVNRFVINTLSPDRSITISMSIIVAVLFVLLMVGFSFLALRRMNRISVMDMIHGENRGERFSHIPGVRISRSKKLSVPLLLALQDVVRKMKRYIFLVVSYTAAMLILFMLVQVKATVVSDEYRRIYWQSGDRDFRIRPTDDKRDRLIDMTGSGRSMLLYFERLYNDNGIPVDIQIVDVQEVHMIKESGNIWARLAFGDYDPDKLVITEGGRHPELPNEILVSHFLQDSEGVEIGDVVTLEYEVYKADGFDTEMITRDFLVTGYVESMGRNYPVFYSRLNDDIVIDDYDLFNASLNVPDDEYDAYIEKMSAVDEELRVWDYDRVMEYDLEDSYGKLLDLLILATGIIMIVTLFSMTFLYQQIFIEEETSDIAMLKSMGFDGASIGRWHLYRFFLLVVIAALLSVLLAFTFNKVLFESIGCTVLWLENFDIASPPLMWILSLPAGLFLTVYAVMMVSLGSLDMIKIWRIRNE